MEATEFERIREGSGLPSKAKPLSTPMHQKQPRLERLDPSFPLRRLIVASSLTSSKQRGALNPIDTMLLGSLCTHIWRAAPAQLSTQRATGKTLRTRLVATLRTYFANAAPTPNARWPNQRAAL